MGIVIPSFFTVFILVMGKLCSILSPVMSFIFTLSHTLNDRIYVMTTPAIVLVMTEDEPNERRTARNIDTPFAAALFEPGRYGNIITRE